MQTNQTEQPNMLTAEDASVGAKGNVCAGVWPEPEAAAGVPGGAGRVTNCCCPPAGNRTDCNLEGSINMAVHFGGDLNMQGQFFPSINIEIGVMCCFNERCSLYVYE